VLKTLTLPVDLLSTELDGSRDVAIDVGGDTISTRSGDDGSFTARWKPSHARARSAPPDVAVRPRAIYHVP